MTTNQRLSYAALSLSLLCLSSCEGTSKATEMFSQSSYNGAFAYYGHQYNTGADIIGTVVADGAGHLTDTRLQTGIDGGGATVTEVFNCTYQVTTNGTGTESCVNSTTGSRIASSFVLASSNSEVYRTSQGDQGGGVVLLVGKLQ